MSLVPVPVSFVGAFVGGTLMTGMASESGPGALAAGAWGGIMGAQLGRKLFGYLGVFNYNIFAISKIKMQFEDFLKFNKSHYPMQIGFPN